MHRGVGGVAGGFWSRYEREGVGKKVVDHGSSKPVRPYEGVRTINALRNGLQVVRTLLQMRKVERALEKLRGKLTSALFRIEAFHEFLALARFVVPTNWEEASVELERGTLGILLSNFAFALAGAGMAQEAIVASEKASELDIRLGRR